MSGFPPEMLKGCFRWFGPNDPVSLDYIAQCGCSGIYTALHHIPYGGLWTREEIRKRIALLAQFNLEWVAAESVPVSEDIKTRGGDYERHLDNYAQSLENLGAEGVKVVIYNFMPVLDWVRTNMGYQMPDGTVSTYYDPALFAAFDVYMLQRPGAEADWTPEQLEKARRFLASLTDAGRIHFERSIVDVFPGVKLGLSLDDLRRMLGRYAGIDADRLREHLRLFLQHVLPAAERAGVRLAVHPDDPPYSILGLARIVSTEDDLRRVVGMVDSTSNGICYCTGSLSVRADNDLPGIVERLGRHIHATHLRSVHRLPDGSFYEASHLEGSVDMPAVVAALLRENARRQPDERLSVRPDHGLRMLDDLKKPPLPVPGYDCIGRMRGLAELRGLQLGLLAGGVLNRP